MESCWIMSPLKIILISEHSKSLLEVASHLGSETKLGQTWLAFGWRPSENLKGHSLDWKVKRRSQMKPAANYLEHGHVREVTRDSIG